MSRQPDQRPGSLRDVFSRIVKPAEESAAARRSGEIRRVLGAPLQESPDGRFRVDLTGLRVMGGLTALATHLARITMDQCRRDASDVLASGDVDEESTLELAVFGVNRVVIHVRSPLTRRLVENPDGLTRRFRGVFDALQSNRWNSILFNGYDPVTEREAVQGAGPGAALCFQFPEFAADGLGCFFLVEFLPEGRFLRVTVESTADSRLQLRRIPHHLVAEPGRRPFRQDAAALADALLAGMHREIQNNRPDFTETPESLEVLFSHLDEGGLRRLSEFNVRWMVSDAQDILRGEDYACRILLTKALLALEEMDVLRLLAEGREVTVVAGRREVHLGVSRNGVALHADLGARRPPPDLGRHLVRLPRLHQLQQTAGTDVLAPYRILLIHHATSETFGFVRALEAAGCAACAVLFIRYRGITPPQDLEDLLSLPEPRFRFHELQHVEMRDSVTGTYLLSRRYSLPGPELVPLDEALRRKRGSYLDAMRLAALHLLFLEALAAKREGKKLLLIEDGGYAAPVLHQNCLQGRSLSETLANCTAIPAEVFAGEGLSTPLRDWLEGLLPATFEHTANGWNALGEVVARLGAAAFPSLTIALSNYKNTLEAEACACSILNSVETILAGLGRTLMYRRALILGSRGHIGRHIFHAVRQRATYGSATGLDLHVRGDPAPGEYADISEIPREERRSFDLFIGVTGLSVLKAPFWEDLLAWGPARDVFVASGSTKTVEFADLAALLDQATAADGTRWGPEAVRGAPFPIHDAQTSLLLGHGVKLHFTPPRTPREDGTARADCEKRVWMLADGMPVNFLHYGVPAEVIDGVFAELFTLVTAWARRDRQGERLPPGLYALDRNLLPDGTPSAARG